MFINQILPEQVTFELRCDDTRRGKIILSRGNKKSFGTGETGSFKNWMRVIVHGTQSGKDSGDVCDG